MNRYSWWKNLSILAVLLLGGLYALPNVFGSDPALEVTQVRDGILDLSTLALIEQTLQKADIKIKKAKLADETIVVRFFDTESQLKARELISGKLGRNYNTALNLAAAGPEWLDYLNAEPMFLGLDLRGGVHFLMEVDMESVQDTLSERYVGDFKSLLRDNKIRYSLIRHYQSAEGAGLELQFKSAEVADQAERLILQEYPEITSSRSQAQSIALLRVQIADALIRETQKLALQQNITTLRNRVNELGVAEPIIQQHGESRIVVQLPGVADPAVAREIIGATATLEFKLVDEAHSLEQALAGRPPLGSQLYDQREGGKILLYKRTILSGEHITNAASGIDQTNGEPIVNVTLDGPGAAIFEKVTGENIGRRLAVIFIENKTEIVTAQDGSTTRIKKVIEEVITAPNIRDRLGRRFQISGSFTTSSAHSLALLLRAGSLAAPVSIVEERTIGPSLGKNNVDQGARSVVIGLVLVLAFMAFWYKGFGMVANVALAANLVLLVAVLSLLQATLTLPGIAGIVLIIGMAVDTNVLIFQRIRDEIRNGNTPQASIAAGYSKAFSTILDSNLTTLIAALVLFMFGTGPIKGFAVTLSVGIMTSMFTGIMVSRAIVNLVWGGKRQLKKLSI